MSALNIFVNRKRKTQDDGVTPEMSIDGIAALAGLTGDTAVVREQQGESGKVGAPLQGTITITSGMHFIVTRKGVEGG